MKNDAYWTRRFEMLEEAANKMGRDAYKEIEPAFTKAQFEIRKQIEYWVDKIAENNEVSLADARKLLDEDELEEFHWTVDEYVKYGRENNLNGKWVKELENASAKYHISKLEALNINARQALERAFGEEDASVEKMARKVYTEGYYHTAFEVQKGVGAGWEIGKVDQKKIDRTISKPWAADGLTFSDRIWKRKDQMVSELQKQITQTMVLGGTADEAAEALTKYVKKNVNNAKMAAKRLVMTEQAFFHSESQKEAFKGLDVEQYEIVATLDSRTSEICQEMDGQVFDMKDFQTGVTAPPFHVWCRSVVAPYFDDEFDYVGERAARGEDGKTYYVPADTTYPEWKKAFVGGDVSGFDAIKDEMKTDFVSNISFDFKNKEKWKQEEDLILRLEQQYNTRLQSVKNGAQKAAGDVDISGATMRLNAHDQATVVHEFAHSMANSNADKYGLTDNGDFWKEIKKIRRNYMKDVENDPGRWISTYEHSSRDVDEFFAEAFAHAKMREMGIEIPERYGKDFTYSSQVLDVVDKYFGKSLKPSVNSVKIKSTNASSNVVRTKDQFEKVARNIKDKITNYSTRSSKWSGRINVEENLGDACGVKNWSCDISVLNNVDDGTLWHEMLHSCSASYYDPTIYAKNQYIEEASVEFLTQQICAENNIPFTLSYETEVTVLKMLNNALPYETDMDFARELFNVALPDRYEWLEKKVYACLREANASIKDFEEVMEYVRRLEGGPYGII